MRIDLVAGEWMLPPCAALHPSTQKASVLQCERENVAVRERDCAAVAGRFAERLRLCDGGGREIVLHGES